MLGFERVHIGMSENRIALTGCTVLLFDGGARASVDVRGAAPGTRETALLAPDKQMDRVDAILLTGGSAYGLAAANGVVKYLSEKGAGYKTPWNVVPIVPAAVIYDLNVGSNDVFPNDEMGYQSCLSAEKGEFLSGSHGAGTGATVGKWAGIEYAMKSGQGMAALQVGQFKVSAIVVVNCVGDVIGSDGRVIAGAIKGGNIIAQDARNITRIPAPPASGINTTLCIVLTNASFSKVELNRIAQRGHDGLARKIVPVHTSFDGDTVFAVSLDEVQGPLDVIAGMAVDVIEMAIEDAIKSAEPLCGLPAYSDLRKSPTSDPH
ncbi:MAG: P1 family peptidase [Candidatus Kryptoniota bacterium]